LSWALAIVALAVLGVAVISRLLSGTPITPAMVFVAIGVLGMRTMLWLASRP
jgi:sodium/hydrogen antiporter